MNRWQFICIIFGLSIVFSTQESFTKNDSEKTFEEEAAQPKKLKKKLISFDFDNEELASIVNKFAKLQKTNIILPQGANTLTQKITFKLNHKITIEEAEQFLNTFLDLAGYSKVPHGDFYMIVKNDQNVAREQLPLYVDVPPQDLPSSGRIQVIYYLQNIKVPATNQGTDPLHVILNDMLSPQRNYQFDSKANAIIIADKAPNIKAVMSMLLELDNTGVKDIIHSIQLFNTVASTVAKLLQEQIIAVSGTSQGTLRADVKSEAGLYFAPGTKIVSDPRTNSLILMGKEPAVERVIEFIREYIDVPLESGKSILHFYELQYLDAITFAEVLKKIVASQAGEESAQATTEEIPSTPGRTFEGVIIAAEEQVEEKLSKAELAEAAAKKGRGEESVLRGIVTRGGNRIIVAARERDWLRIEKLIKSLDRPQLQVVLQVMIVDFEIDTRKVFGTQTRNPAMLNLPPGFNFQTTHLVAPPITASPASAPPQTLAFDLLTLLGGTIGSPTLPSAAGRLVNLNPSNIGSFILSLNDPSGSGIWTFLQWLNNFGETKVLSHPYLIALNNYKAEEEISTNKFLPSDAKLGEGGVIASTFKYFTAALRVAVVPRASSRERVNLQISITIDQFVDPTSTTLNNKLTREVHTNVNMSSGNMLVLGGFSGISETDIDRETPLLGKIPVIRWFFSNTTVSKSKNNLSVFIIPTIVEPKIRAGMNSFSRDKINESYGDIAQGNLFEQMRDPVNYLFFKEQEDTAALMLDEYLADSAGDYVRPATRTKSRGPKCDKNTITSDSQQLKMVLASEENPLLATPIPPGASPVQIQPPVGIKDRPQL